MIRIGVVLLTFLAAEVRDGPVQVSCSTPLDCANGPYETGVKQKIKIEKACYHLHVMFGKQEFEKRISPRINLFFVERTRCWKKGAGGREKGLGI